MADGEQNAQATIVVAELFQLPKVLKVLCLLTASQAVNLIKKFDNSYPEPYLEQYLDYMQIDMNEFQSALDKHANKELFQKIDGRWMPKFEVE